MFSDLWIPSELLRRSLWYCSLAIDRPPFNAKVIVMASQFIRQKSSSRPTLQNTHSILKLLSQSNISCNYPTIRTSLTNVTSLAQFWLNLIIMKFLVGQGKRNIRKTPRQDLDNLLNCTYKCFQSKLSFSEYLYFWRINWEAIAITLVLVGRLNGSLPLVI